MAKAKKPLRWAKGTKHPRTKKLVAGQIMSKEDRARYTTKGKLRKGAKRAAPKKAAPKKAAPKKAAPKKAAPKKAAPKSRVAKKNPSKIKIAQTRKTAPGGWKSSMGPYAIVTAKGNVVKGGSFRSLAAAKKALAGMRDKGRKGLRLVKVSIPKKAAKKAPAKKNPGHKTAAKRKKSYKSLLKRLGV